MPTRLGRLLGLVYEHAVRTRNGWYDVNPGRKAERPVISIGNLTAGGTGKTPMVVHLATVLKEAGKRPAIALRGYKSATKAPADSDEAQQYARLLPGVPLAVGPRRLDEIKELLTTSKGSACDCILLDDGFQHRQLFRDLDIVLLDATRGTPTDRQLPAGWLREPLTGLRRAQAVVITHAESVPTARISALELWVQDITDRRPVAVCRHAWTNLLSGEGQQLRTLPADFLKGRKVALACALGNPAPFVNAVKAQATVVHEAILPDHDPFAATTVAALTGTAKNAGAEALVVTEKDWSKLRALPEGTWPFPVLRPRLALKFDRGQGDLSDLVLSAIRSWKKP